MITAVIVKYYITKYTRSPMQFRIIIVLILAACCHSLHAQKLVTIGDSQTSLCGWQPSVVEQTGFEWSREETTEGIDGHQPMAVGGTWMKPINQQSISLRGRDAVYYQPDKIIIYGGQNDGWGYWRSSDNYGITPMEQVLCEKAYTQDAVNKDVSTISAFKGLIEYLLEALPNTQIYLMTHVPVLCVIGMNPDEEFSKYYPSPRFKDMDDVIKFEKYNREPKDEIIRTLGEYYDLPVIDLWKYSGITYYNTEQYYGTPAGDCTQVHLNQEGELLIADCIVDYLKNAPLHYDPDWMPYMDGEEMPDMSVTIHAEDYGVSPDNSAAANCQGLNSALANGGHVVLDTPGTYQIAGTTYIPSNTILEFGQDVKLVRQAQWTDCMPQLFINRRAKERVYDHDITIRGLNLDANNLGGPMDENMIKGLMSVMGFFYVKNLCIEDLTITNLPKHHFGLQVCTFDSLLIDHADIQGQKDAIHLGRGRNYTIRNSVFAAGDDPIALNGHDYVISNPELGWIENGIIENCTDQNYNNNIGFFCRMLAGSWCDWRDGMELRYGDAVVSQGRIYRLMNQNDTLVSTQQPVHANGECTYNDGCVWYMQQDKDVCYDAGVRNLHFDNIYLQRPRDIAFSFHFDNDSYSRSFYPGAKTVAQTGFTFDHIYQQAPIRQLMAVTIPVDTIRIMNSVLDGAYVNIRGYWIEGLTYDTTVIVLKDVELPNIDNFISTNAHHPSKLVVESQMGIEAIEEDKCELSPIYNINGRRMPKSDQIQLPEGLYIIDKKKIWVR